jgi:PAS domain S-box-containing protein
MMKSRFIQLFELSPDAMVIVDRTGQIHQANRRAEQLFGYGRDQLRGESVQTLFPGQPIVLAESRGAEEPTGRHLDLVGSTSDLRQFAADVNVIPLQTERGTANLISIRDITEEQRAKFVLELGLEAHELADRDRRALLDYLIRAQEEERGRIAAGIHDDTIQVLAAANLRLQQLKNRLEEPEELDILDKLEKTLSMALSHLRQLIFDLRPTSLEHGSLSTAVHVVLEEMRSDLGIAYQLDDRCNVHLHPSVAVLIYRTTREALANVRKHARANNVLVQFRDVGDGCLARIVDDGVGYNPAEVEDRPGHIGLSLMRERAEIAEGWCRIESRPGAGTTVEFWIPHRGHPRRPGTGHERAA